MGGGEDTVAVATDCRNGELLTGMASFHEALKTRWHDELFSPDMVLTLLRPRPALSLEDVQRQVESARTLYYAGQLERALELARQASLELEKISPTVKPWPVTADALLLQGISLKALDRKPEATELFRRVLRVDPAYKLDPDIYTPSTIQLFELLRKELQRTRKAVLQVQSTPGAEVFVDGRSVGKVPFKGEWVPGSYRVSVAQAEQVSFPHVVTLPKEGALQIDLAFEGALLPQVPLCLASSTTPAESLAQKVANAVGAQNIVVFWKEGRDGPPFYRALILRNGVKDREGGVQVTPGAPSAPIDELANFIVTGQGNGIVGREGAPTPPAPVENRSENKQFAAVPPPPTVAPSPALSPVVEVTESNVRVSKVVGFSLLGAAVVSAAAGVVVFATASGDRERFAQLTAAGQLPPVTDSGHRQALDLMTGIEANRLTTFALVGAGVGLAVSSALTFLLFSQAPRAASVTVTPVLTAQAFGASVSVALR